MAPASATEEPTGDAVVADERLGAAALGGSPARGSRAPVAPAASGLREAPPEGADPPRGAGFQARPVVA
jgi:hypothetical protein